MKHPVQIYFRALGLYALVTLPTIGLPIMYFISLMYAVTYGFFALAVFALVYYLITPILGVAAYQSARVYKKIKLHTNKSTVLEKLANERNVLLKKIKQLSFFDK